MSKEEHFVKFNLSRPARYLGVVLLTLIALVTLTNLFLILAGQQSSSYNAVSDSLLSTLYGFLILFLLYLSKRKRTFVKNNWWLVLGALPLEIFAGDHDKGAILLALLYLARFSIRIIVLMRISRILVPRNYALEVFTSLGTLIFVSTALFYNAEHLHNPEVNTYFDSFYWSIVTGTTVGYGDISPVTTTGRVIAVFMMVIGIGVFGLVTGTVANWFNRRAQERFDKTTKN